MDHVRIGVYTLTKGTLDDIVELTKAGMLEIFRAQPGFRRYGIAGGDGGSVLSISIWETHDEAERASVLAADWVKDNIADRVKLVELFVGDFAFFEE